MTNDEIKTLALKSGFTLRDLPDGHDLRQYVYDFADSLIAAERETWPNLQPVIAWLENGCDPKEAAKELRIYDDAIRARGNK